MARGRGEGRLLALRRRLSSAGLGGVFREAWQLPAALASPIARLATVLRVPPIVLWAALLVLLSSAVLAVSWIMTALILAITRPKAAWQRGEDAGADQQGLTAHAMSDAESGDEAADEAEAVAAGKGPQLPAAGPPAPSAAGSGPAPRQAGAAGLTALPPPFMHEPQAAEVQKLVEHIRLVIPADPLEAARVVDQVFGLGLTAQGYVGLMAAEDEGKEVAGRGGPAAAAAGDQAGCMAALGQLALEAHMARYVAGLHGSVRHARGAASAGGGARSDGSGGRLDNRQGPASASAGSGRGGGSGSFAAVALAQRELPAYEALEQASALCCPATVEALARRLRLALLIRPRGGTARNTARTQAGGPRGGMPEPDPRRKPHAAEQGSDEALAPAAGEAGRPGRMPAEGPGAALLRLVWAAHAADPDRAWRACCVLAGLAVDLRLVSPPWQCP
ncbi:hypothetical protein HYH03_012610 [Edaphochlamys debaryana]|uniref:Uncharacterized protein n=1 Tax=Edaphochlamys debaryana TaxID=47281 RepID=A0A835XV03_9CHLO|nr:hypothetical protein HYH03_012610 [Edaphochlamys debaryana]|eukprot:KAG2488811.1 hypothetical protein HYH03_012610 [Edaphochlamys debaryana]